MPTPTPQGDSQPGHSGSMAHAQIADYRTGVLGGASRSLAARWGDLNPHALAGTSPSIRDGQLPHQVHSAIALVNWCT